MIHNIFTSYPFTNVWPVFLQNNLFGKTNVTNLCYTSIINTSLNCYVFYLIAYQISRQITESSMFIIHLGCQMSYLSIEPV